MRRSSHLRWADRNHNLRASRRVGCHKDSQVSSISECKSYKNRFSGNGLVTPAAIRKTLGPMLYLIRFPTMDAIEFLRYPLKSGILGKNVSDSFLLYQRVFGHFRTRPSCLNGSQIRRNQLSSALRSEPIPTRTRHCTNLKTTTNRILFGQLPQSSSRSICCK